MLPPRYLNRIKRLRVPSSVFQTYMVTDLDLGKLNLEHENFYFKSLNNLKIASSFKRLGISQDKPLVFSISCPSLVDSTLAPQGFQTLVVSTFAPFDIGVDWRMEKEKMEQILIQMASKKIKNLDQHIIFKESGTPATMKRYTLNSYGSPYGWEQSKHQMFRRPQSFTPIKNLYLVGHWTNSGGGVVSSLLSSYKLAKLLEEKEH